MKVFISWSGSRSKKVATIFRDWLPQVIQSLEPFVSSEDIEKGARWNTDIAQELKESTFGIICVTKENLSAPWLNFEAGALSKTIENSFVAPFLFDVKPSDLKDSPIAQFQATSFSKEEVKRLIETLNTATGNSRSAHMLEKAFDLWYPVLEQDLTALKSEPNDEASEESNHVINSNSAILEELLEMTRNIPRLLGNTDNKLNTNLESLHKRIEEFTISFDRQYSMNSRRPQPRKFRQMFLEEFLYSGEYNESNIKFPYGYLIILSLYREDFPWIYEAGSEMIKVVQSNSSKSVKYNAVEQFRELINITDHPKWLEPFNVGRNELRMLEEITMRIMNEIETFNGK